MNNLIDGNIGEISLITLFLWWSHSTTLFFCWMFLSRTRLERMWARPSSRFGSNSRSKLSTGNLWGWSLMRCVTRSADSGDKSKMDSSRPRRTHSSRMQATNSNFELRVDSVHRPLSNSNRPTWAWWMRLSWEAGAWSPAGLGSPEASLRSLTGCAWLLHRSSRSADLHFLLVE